MRKLFILCTLMLVASSAVMAQETPKAEIFGGYQYIRLNPGDGASGSNCQGAAGSVTGNINHWFGGVADFGACRLSGLPSGSSGHLVNYLFGPKFSYRSHGRMTPYAQVLFGGQHFGTSIEGVSGSDSSFAMTFGGGADFEMTNHISLRLIQVEYLYTKFDAARQNNARITSGIVYRWGAR